MLLEKKCAVITGCNRGIGKAVLQKFCEYGADVFAVIRKENAEFTSYCEALTEKYKNTISIFYADFSDEESVKQAGKNILATKRKIDVLVNNIGISNPLNTLMMTKIETIKEAFQINYFSAIVLTQIISKNMMRSKMGSIIFVSSSAAFDGGANIEYCASKAAMVGSVKRLARELGAFDIRVNAVAPGLTSTDMGNSMSEEDEKIALSMNIMHRKGEPEEVADVIAFLGSDMSRFMTGQVLRVDGGLIG